MFCTAVVDRWIHIQSSKTFLKYLPITCSYPTVTTPLNPFQSFGWHSKRKKSNLPGGQVTHWRHVVVSLTAGHLDVICNLPGAQDTCLRGRLGHNGMWQRESASYRSLAPYWTQDSTHLMASFLVHLCKYKWHKTLIFLVWCCHAPCTEQK